MKEGVDNACAIVNQLRTYIACFREHHGQRMYAIRIDRDLRAIVIAGSLL